MNYEEERRRTLRELDRQDDGGRAIQRIGLIGLSVVGLMMLWMVGLLLISATKHVMATPVSGCEFTTPPESQI